MNPKRTANPSEALDIVALKQRYEDLQKEKTRAETKLDTAEKELRKLRKEAKEDYGTDDLAELQAQLETRKQENEKKLAAYQKSLEKIEGDLEAVEAKYDESRKGEAE